MTTISNLILAIFLVLSTAGTFAIAGLFLAFLAVKNGATFTFGYRQDEENEEIDNQ